MKSPFSRFFGSGEKELDPLVEEEIHHEEIEQVKIELIKPNKYHLVQYFLKRKLKNLREQSIHMVSFNQLSFGKWMKRIMKLLLVNEDIEQ